MKVPVRPACKEDDWDFVFETGTSSGFCTQSEGDRQIRLSVSCNAGSPVTTPANFLEVYSWITT